MCENMRHGTKAKESLFLGPASVRASVSLLAWAIAHSKEGQD